MGIDIYMSWDKITEEEKKEQFTGFSVVHGNAGYLREAYHGGPYCTQVLVPESFEEDELKGRKNNGDHGPYFGAEISSEVLESRLKKATKALIERYRKVYQEKLTEESPEVISLKQFVELAKKKEAETGKPVRIYASH